MAGVTVIDELLVKLGLDPRDFAKGEKEAARAQLDMEQTVKRSNNRMSKELTGMAAKWLSIAGAIMLVKKAVSVIDDVAERTRRLGVDAKNYGFAAANLRNFENAVEMFGGTAEEARKSIAGFNKSVFDLAYNGVMSDSLVMLARLGVQFQTATGDARDFKDIALDTADAIEQAQKQGMSRQNAFQFLQQAGFDQGTAQMLLAGRANAEAALRAQEGRRQVSGEDIAKATEIRQASISKDQAVEGLEIAGMKNFGGIQEGVNKFIEHLAGPGGANAALGDLSKATTSLGDQFEKLTLDISAASGITRGIRNNNPGNIRAVGDQARDRKGFRTFPTMQEGVLKANEQLDKYAARGLTTIRKIITAWAPPTENDTEAYIKEVVGYTGLKEDADVGDSRAMLLAAMFRHESGAKAPDSGAVADILQSGTSDDAAAEAIINRQGGGANPSPNAQASTFNKTDVQIDNITVNTKATDAEGIAGDMDGAVKRKFLTGHAEVGAQ